MDLSVYSLAGQTALVTGASGGLGKETALALADVGCDVVIAARNLPALDDVAAAVAELKAGGLNVLQDTKLEAWGQTLARLLSPEGLLIGLTFTPWLRDQAGV